MSNKLLKCEGDNCFFFQKGKELSDLNMETFTESSGERLGENTCMKVS